MKQQYTIRTVEPYAVETQEALLDMEIGTVEPFGRWSVYRKDEETFQVGIAGSSFKTEMDWYRAWHRVIS